MNNGPGPEGGPCASLLIAAHPIDDGNCRIARAISGMALERFDSMAAQIRENGTTITTSSNAQIGAMDVNRSDDKVGW